MPEEKERVIVRRLKSPHQKESFTKFLPLNNVLKEEIFAAVQDIFEEAGGKSLLKASGDVYLKPNGIDSKAYCYTRAELVEAVIRYWKKNGAKNSFNGGCHVRRKKPVGVPAAKRSPRGSQLQPSA